MMKNTIFLLGFLLFMGGFALTGFGQIQVVAFGDSTTAERDTIEAVFAQRLPGLLLEKGVLVRVHNAGVGGNTTADARKRFEQDVLARNPDLVIIQFGLNDSCIDLHKGKTEPRLSQQAYEDNLRYFVTTLQHRGVEVVLMTPNAMRWTDKLKERFGKPPFDVNDRWGLNPSNENYAKSTGRIAKAYGTPLVDMYRFYRDCDLKAGFDADELLLDGIHPNDQGHTLIARFLADLIHVRITAQEKQKIFAPGYTIPLIDLAHDKARQVIVDREPGQYLGHPTTVLFEDGKTMLCVYPKGHGKGGIVMKRSTDSGLTWSERLPTPESWATSREVPTLYPVIDDSGKKGLIMFSGLYPIRMAHSKDMGGTWSELEPIGDFGGIVAMGCMDRLKNGDYMALFHDDGRFFREKGKRTNLMWVYKTLSHDGGMTWSEPEVIATHPFAHPCEPGLVRSPDGNQIAVLLRENSRKCNAFVIFSDDEGVTWTRPRQMPAALTGDRHTGRYGPDGRLFISFRDTTRSSETQGDWVGWVGTYDDMVSGKEGQYRVRLMDNRHKWDCAYPGVEVLPDGTFVTTTYGHWIEGEQPFIVSVRFTLEELDQKWSQKAH